MSFYRLASNITPSISHFPAPPTASGTASTPQRPSNPPAPFLGPVSALVLTFEENPLAEFVELPEEALEGGLWYGNVFVWSPYGYSGDGKHPLVVASLAFRFTK